MKAAPPFPSPAGSSIDPGEMAHFERLATQWWNPHGPFWPLHRLNEVRIGYLRAALVDRFGPAADPRTPLAGLRILDIGCGGGLLSEALARLGAHVHGVDIVAQNLRIAALHARDMGLDIRYECGTAEQLAATGARYDAVMNLEVVEHVADRPAFLGACCRLVRPGGLIAIASLNRTVLAWVAAILVGEYVLGWLPRGTHHWAKFPRPAELECLLAQHGLMVTGRIGVRINPWTKRFALSRRYPVNFMLTAVKPTGGLAARSDCRLPGTR